MKPKDQSALMTALTSAKNTKSKPQSIILITTICAILNDYIGFIASMAQHPEDSGGGQPPSSPRG